MLREKLEDLYLLREQQRLQGQYLRDLNSQIVAVKRIQRQAPQLQEGEILGDRYRLREAVGRGGGVGGRTYRWLNPPPPVDPEADAAKLLVDIDSDLASQRWMDARAKANRLSRNPTVSPKTRESASSRCARAELEVKVQRPPSLRKALPALCRESS